MAFVKTSELVEAFYKKNNRNGRGQRLISDVAIGTDFGGLNKARQRIYQLSVKVSKDIAKKARIIHGDRLEISFDKDSDPPRALITRVTEGGWKAIPVSKSHDAGLVFRITMYDGMPSFKSTAQCEAVVTDEGILFDLPKNHSFTQNLREVEMQKS